MIRQVLRSLRKKEVWLVALLASLSGVGLYRGGWPWWGAILSSFVMVVAWYTLGSWRIRTHKDYRFRRYWRPCPTCLRDPWSKDFWEDHNSMGHVSGREPMP